MFMIGLLRASLTQSCAGALASLSTDSFQTAPAKYLIWLAGMPQGKLCFAFVN
jgi:hypothetical protein